MSPPQPNDGLLESEIRVDSPDLPDEEKSIMDPTVASLMTQQLTQTGIIAQNNFVTTTKLSDLDYLEQKRIVSLDEAIGVREVSATNSPGGPARV